MSDQRNILEANVQALNFSYNFINLFTIFLWFTGQLSFLAVSIVFLGVNFIMLFYNNITENLNKNPHLASDQTLMRRLGIFK